jgi:hypothetical protein
LLSYPVYEILHHLLVRRVEPARFGRLLSGSEVKVGTRWRSKIEDVR